MMSSEKHDFITGMFSNSSGLVMLEGILVLPVYLVMFGMLFWMADLTWIHSQVTVAEHYAAWNQGVRYGDRRTNNDRETLLASLYWASHANNVAISTSTGGEKNIKEAIKGFVAAGVAIEDFAADQWIGMFQHSLAVQVSPWGMWNSMAVSGDVMAGKSPSQLSTVQVSPINSHQVFARRSGVTREKKSEDLATKSSFSWLGYSSGAGEYERFSQYDTWSE